MSDLTEERNTASNPESAPAGAGTPGVDRGDRVHEFHGEGVTVTWSRRRCIHAAACVMNLPKVFAPGRRPWVDATRAPAETVAHVVAMCPTGALHGARSDGGTDEQPPTENSVLVTRNGPLYVHGQVEVRDDSGAVRLVDTRVALCRCGGSANQPLCDGAHLASGFRDAGTVHAGAALGDPIAPRATLRAQPEPQGPLVLEGPFTLSGSDRRTTLLGSAARLCRCGGSGNKPFCDGTHLREGF